MTDRPAMQALRGTGVSDGVAVGRAVVIARRDVEVFRIPISDDRIASELDRLRSARDETLREIDRNRSRAGSLFGEELSTIFDAHTLLLADRSFLEDIERRIARDHVNAEWAVHEASLDLSRRFAAIDDEYLRERGQDFEDVSRELLRKLQGIAHHEISEVEGPVILVADDIVPSEAIRLGRLNVVGFVTEAGSRTSHTSIIARSLGIPAVAALERATETIVDEDPIIVDGRTGDIVLHPTPETLARYDQVRDGLRRVSARPTPAVAAGVPTTLDGVEVALLANIDLPEELDQLAASGARGIGLYRSEFLYMETDPVLPTEEDHRRIYRQLLDAAAPHPAVIRTYDLGGRKLAREMMDSTEENPVLGLRGIRLTLARPQIFETQLRGLLRAGAGRELWVMAPLVTRVEEVRALRATLRRIEEELDAAGEERTHSYKLGIMVEVPAAAIIVDLLADEVDFMAIGTNDLIQYTLAVDRNNQHVADLYQPLHPAILRMLRSIAAAGAKAGIPVSLCGEIGGDASLTPLLLGLGLRRFSAHPRSLQRLRRVVAENDVSRLTEIASRCCELATAAEVEEYLRREESPPAAAEA